MTNASGSPPPGWYYAAGDPIGTQRYWDGAQWVGQPMWIPQPAPGYQIPGFLPGINRSLADPGQRIVARLIDIALYVVVAIVVIIVVVAGMRNDGFERDEYVNLTIPFAILVAAYEIGFTAWRGGTLGKLIMGIGVVTHDGKHPPGIGPATLRYLPSLVGLIPILGGPASIVMLIISFVFLFTDDRRRTIPDRIASTYVVDTRGRG